MECDTFTTNFAKPGIISSSGSAFGRPHVRTSGVDGPDGHCMDHNHREREFGRIPSQTHDLVKGKLHDTFPHDNLQFPEGDGVRMGLEGVTTAFPD